MRVDLTQVSRSPKSTVIGLCVLALAAERGVHFDSAGHLLMSTRDWFEVGCGVLTAFVSGVSQDAESTPTATAATYGTNGSEMDRSQSKLNNTDGESASYANEH